MKKPPLFVTERLIIRPIQLSDSQAYFEIFGAEDVAEFDDFEPISKEEAIEDVKLIIEKETDSARDEFEFAVTTKESDDLIGVLYFKPEDECLFIGYHFHGNSRGKGFAREAVAGLIFFLKSKYAQQIRAKVDAENIRSIHLLEQLGFQRMEDYAIAQFFKGADHVEWCFEL
ncbi:N-acetyltransferase [bacterium]|nr:MAG: N-acetyltransferase [bacterium]